MAMNTLMRYIREKQKEREDTERQTGCTKKDDLRAVGEPHEIQGKDSEIKAQEVRTVKERAKGM